MVKFFFSQNLKSALVSSHYELTVLTEDLCVAPKPAELKWVDKSERPTHHSQLVVYLSGSHHTMGPLAYMRTASGLSRLRVRKTGSVERWGDNLDQGI